MKLLLFDIDGTLIRSDGAGKRAMNAAFAEVFGIPNALDGISLAGCTDLAIVGAAIKKHGLKNNNENVDRFRKCYFKHIQIEIRQPQLNLRVLPGIRDLLEDLQMKPHVCLGLLTGNWEFSGRVKLAAVGLADYFKSGAFADDSGVRTELLPPAVRRFEKMYNIKIDVGNVYVIGDTFADIEVAHAYNANSVAVSTGPYSLQELLAHKADYVFEDFSDKKRALEILG